MIAPLLKTNSLIIYHINCGHLSLFGNGYPIYCHNGELIRGQILLTSILKPHQETPLTIDSFHHTSQLITHPSEKLLPKIILQLT